MNKLKYYNPNTKDSYIKFCKGLNRLLEENDAYKREIVIVCIGSDRATGDCLGPLVGHKLTRNGCVVSVYGTLDSPVHAINLYDTLTKIKEEHDNPFIIAVDASLGNSRHVGYVTLQKGSLKPGIGVEKTLPLVGDICITGIVGSFDSTYGMLLQTIRLHLVMELSDFIYNGLKNIS